MAGELHQHCPLQTNQFLGALPRDTMLGCFLVSSPHFHMLPL